MPSDIQTEMLINIFLSASYQIKPGLAFLLPAQLTLNYEQSDLM